MSFNNCPAFAALGSFSDDIELVKYMQQNICVDQHHQSKIVRNKLIFIYFFVSFRKWYKEKKKSTNEVETFKRALKDSSSIEKLTRGVALKSSIHGFVYTIQSIS